jgi:hypothetical protein
VPLGIYPLILGEGVGVTVQANVVPPTLEVRVTNEVGLPEHTDCDIVLVTIGLGFTVITCVVAIPLQPPMEGVIVYVTLPGAVSVELIRLTLPAIVFPEPDGV